MATHPETITHAYLMMLADFLAAAEGAATRAEWEGQSTVQIAKLEAERDGVRKKLDEYLENYHLQIVRQAEARLSKNETQDEQEMQFQNEHEMRFWCDILSSCLRSTVTLDATPVEVADFGVLELRKRTRGLV